LKIEFATRDEESRFVRQLRLLQDDLSSYVGAIATLVAINERADDKVLLEKLNRHAIPWNCVLAALQHQVIISIGRIHDKAKSAYLRPLIDRLGKASASEYREAAIAFNAAVTNQQVFIDAILKLRHKVFAHTDHDAPVIATFGFDGLTWTMFERYWEDIASAVAGIEGAVFHGKHYPAIDVGEFRNVAAKTASLLDSLK
jgi:hypothetical protein